MGTNNGDHPPNAERDALILFLLSVLQDENDDPWYVTSDDDSRLPEGTFLVGFDVFVEPDTWQRVAYPISVDNLEAVEGMAHVRKVMDASEAEEYTAIGWSDFFSSLQEAAGRFIDA
jgi:hypothetical protein